MVRKHSKRTRLLGSAISVLLLLSSGRASAQSSTADLDRLSLEDLLRMEIPMVEAVSKTSEKANEAPATVLVISDSEIRLRGYMFLEDVMRDLPGFEVNEYGSARIGTSVPVRGLPGNNTSLVLLNGMRLNPGGGFTMPYRRDFYIGDAQRIEVVYGAGSTMYGQDAISSVINVVTKKTEKDSLQARFGAGIPGSGVGELSFAKKLDNVSVSGWVSYQDSKPTDIASQYPTEFARYTAIAKSRGSDLSAQQFDHGLNAFIRAEMGSTSLQVSHRQSGRNTGAEGDTFGRFSDAGWYDTTTAAQLRNQLNLAQGVDLESTASVNRYEVQPKTTLNVPAGPAGWGIGHVYALGMDSTVEEKLTVRPMKDLLLTAGVAGSMLHVVTPVTGGVLVDPSRDLASQIGSITYFTRKGDPTSRVSLMAGSATDFTNLGAYAEGSWRVLKDLKLIAGVRADKSSRIPQTPVSPRLSLIYDLTQKLNLKYVYSRSFVAPELDIAYLAYADVGHGGHIPNPNLGPERATSNEVSFSYNDTHLGATVSGFHNVLNQIFTDVTVLSQAWVDPAGKVSLPIRQAQNQGRTTATGFDATVKASFWRASVWGSYSFVSLSNEDNLAASLNGNGTSSHNFRLGTTVGVLDNLYATVSFNARSVPTGLDVGVLANELKRIYEVNAYLLYTPVNHLDVFAEVRNATNNHYAVAGGFDPINTTAVPAQTFRTMAGLQLHY